MAALDIELECALYLWHRMSSLTPCCQRSSNSCIRVCVPTPLPPAECSIETIQKNVTKTSS
ncbi:hypothetical protein FKM82_017124 [Ascaphus truei]